jgi:Patatin-like phospholipase
MKSLWTRHFAEVHAAESEIIAAHRRRRGRTQGRLLGLALSGGGIRSACFGLGVLQALDAGGVLERVDYLSTVSGGGYVGSALTWFRRAGRRDFPFGRRGVGARSTHRGESAETLEFLRHHADYLNPSAKVRRRRSRGLFAPSRRAHGRIGLGSLVAVVAKNLIVSLFVYGALLVVAFFLLSVLDAAIVPLQALLGVFARRRGVALYSAAFNVALLLAVALCALFVILSLLQPVAVFLGRYVRAGRPRPPGTGYAQRLRAQGLLGFVWSCAGLTLVIGSVPLLSLLLETWLEMGWQRGALAGVATSVGGLLGSKALSPRSDGSVPQGSLGRTVDALLVPTGAFLMIYGSLLLAYTIAVGIIESGMVWMIFVVLAGGLGLGALTDPNDAGSHPIYRDRLMEAFLPSRSAVAEDEWQPAVEADASRLADMCGADTVGPYHLLNATLITVDSEKVTYRSRGGDSFVLSPLCCGSDATGWVETAAWLKGGMTLATAAAISAAAANPNAGAAGRGLTRNPLVSTLMAVLNLRLGFWAPNPRLAGEGRLRRPNLLRPGLIHGLLGRALDETKPFVELGDGGDFENLGLYELVRRQADLIVACDATADPQLTFSDLGNAVERVRADFGVGVVFADPALDLSGLAPTGTDGRNEGFAARGFAVGEIRYAEKVGVLLYVKAVAIAGLPADVLSRRAEDPSFPNEPTSNQFFDEAQFEAYRELGYRIVKAMLADQRISPLFPDVTSEVRTATGAPAGEHTPSDALPKM